MTLNQIFITKPSIEVIEILLNIIGIKSLNDTRYFYEKDITENIELLKLTLKNNIIKYYLPCKSKIYFKEINSKKVITILRQCLKLYNYSIKYKEKYISEEKKKKLKYQIISNDITIKKLKFD